MRRGLSISLILLLWLPAVAALLPGSEDVRLPFCCRRHGAHHCAMDAGGAGENGGAGESIGAPSRCPQFPGARPAVVPPVVFVATAAAPGPGVVSGACSRVARREAARAGRLRTQLDRGPPCLALA